MDVVRAGKIGTSRKHMPRRKDRKKFSRTASSSHRANFGRSVMRGGTRL